MAICLGHARGLPQYPTLPTLPVHPQSIRVLGAAAATPLVVFGAILASNPNPAFFLAFRFRRASSAHSPKGDGSQRA
eukprot:scaffold20417_cov76-Phaeocystis_antarctica.AAC.2